MVFSVVFNRENLTIVTFSFEKIFVKKNVCSILVQIKITNKRHLFCWVIQMTSISFSFIVFLYVQFSLTKHYWPHHWPGLQRACLLAAFNVTLLILVLEIPFNFQSDMQCAENAKSNISFQLKFQVNASFQQILFPWHIWARSKSLRKIGS